jgi:glycosyltransferase involved in cell wall biosynthesis
MKISLVTLSFNQRAYLQEAIDSVLSQGYRELEYIVVDPGSTDGSRELIQSYSDRVSHVVFEPDKGAADGLNKGFSRATGEVFGFLNADDVLMPGSLQVVADFFQQNQDYAMAFGNGIIIDGEGRKMRDWEARDFTVRRYFYGGAQFLQQSTFFRSAAYMRSLKFNIENKTCWDGELFVSMVNQGAKPGYIRKVLSGFRIHSSSISGSGRTQPQYNADCRRIFRDIRGREWSAKDDLLRFLYRAEGYLIRLFSGFRNYRGSFR